jgi:hypothetical protein
MDKWLKITVRFITNSNMKGKKENKERETVKSKSFVTMIQNENNDKSYDGECFYKHIAALLLLLLLWYLFFLCSTAKKAKIKFRNLFFFVLKFKTQFQNENNKKTL